MATAKQLPSGSWRVQVYDKETGKYLSFTSKLPGKAGKNEAELMAREYQLGRKQKRDDAYDGYISVMKAADGMVEEVPEREYLISHNNSRLSERPQEQPCSTVEYIHQGLDCKRYTGVYQPPCS